MRQAPFSSIIGCIDHVVTVAGDLERAADSYRRLGFTLSPKGVHSASLGSANHTVMLQDDYLELLAVVTPTEPNAPWRQALANGGGIAGVALTTVDAAAARAVWLAAGLAPDDPVHFSRVVRPADGRELQARFEVVTLADLPLTGVRIFVCSQPTREAVWLPELMTHANTARAIAGLTIVSPDPAAAALQWQRVVPGLLAAEAGDGVRLSAGPHTIELTSPGVAWQRFGVTVPEGRTRAIGTSYEVADLDACRATLQANAVPYVASAGEIVVPPEAASHVRITFTSSRN